MWSGRFSSQNNARSPQVELRLCFLLSHCESISVSIDSMRAWEGKVVTTQQLQLRCDMTCNITTCSTPPSWTTRCRRTETLLEWRCTVHSVLEVEFVELYCQKVLNTVWFYLQGKFFNRGTGAALLRQRQSTTSWQWIGYIGDACMLVCVVVPSIVYILSMNLHAQCSWRLFV